MLGKNITSETFTDKHYSDFLYNSLLIRLRLVVPFASLIWEHPKEDECDILEWIRVLVPLLGVSSVCFAILENIIY